LDKSVILLEKMYNLSLWLASRKERFLMEDNKKHVCKVLALAVMAVLMAAVMVATENPNVGRTAADTTQDKSSVDRDYSTDANDILTRGGAAAVYSQETLYMAYSDDEEQPDVDEETFKELIKWCRKNLKLTSIAAAVQTVSDKAEPQGDGTYSMTVPVAALLINGVESVDRLALYAVVQAPGEIGAKLLEVPYETIVDASSGNVLNAKLSLQSAKVLLIIDSKGDGEEETTAGSKAEETSTADEDVEPETKPAEKQTATQLVKENVSSEAESTSLADEPNALAGADDKSPVTGGHDF
jgi:hypothetical protein